VLHKSLGRKCFATCTLAEIEETTAASDILSIQPDEILGANQSQPLQRSHARTPPKKLTKFRINLWPTIYMKGQFHDQIMSIINYV